MDNQNSPQSLPQQVDPSQTQTLSLPGPIALWKEAWRLYKNYFLLYLPFFLLFVIAAFAKNILDIILVNTSLLTTGLYAIGNFLVSLATLYTVLSFLLALKEPEKDIFQIYELSAKKFLPFLLLSVLYVLAVAGGTILLIIPGIIVAVLFYFAFYIFIFENTSIKEAFRRSKQYTKHNMLEVLIRVAFIKVVPNIIVFILLLLSADIMQMFLSPYSPIVAGVSLFFAFVVAFFVTPLDIIYSYLLYNKVRTINPLNEATNQSTTTS